MHRAVPSATREDEEELDDEQQNVDARSCPSDGEEYGEETALEILVAPVEVAPVVRRDGGADDIECAQDEEAKKRVREAVKTRVLVAPMDDVNAVKLVDDEYMNV
jgi:hypothetical protein